MSDAMGNNNPSNILFVILSLSLPIRAAIVESGLPRTRNEIMRGRGNQIVHRKRIPQASSNNLGQRSCDCGTLKSDIEDLWNILGNLQDRILKMEKENIILEESFLTRSNTKQELKVNVEPLPLRYSEPPTVEVTSTEKTLTPETEESIKTTSMPEPQYSSVNCGGNGFYQVGESCYSFTFYRSVKYSEAEHFCNVSGGHLAVLDTAEETDWLRRHLVKHVASNIYPYETVTFFIGGIVDKETKKWTWKTGEEIDRNDGLCLEDYQTGDCVGLTWNLQLGCRFTLTDTECNMKERFICERNPF